jgi:molecular chaperone DnaK
VSWPTPATRPTLIHSDKKALGEYGDKLEAGEGKDRSRDQDLEEAASGGDKAASTPRSTRCEVSQKLGEKIYADSRPRPVKVRRQVPARGRRRSQQAQPQDDNVVDAEFKEVNDKK